MTNADQMLIKTNKTTSSSRRVWERLAMSLDKKKPTGRSQFWGRDKFSQEKNGVGVEGS